MEKSPNETIKLVTASSEGYAARLARGKEEVEAAQVLRYKVFNLELNEGLESSHVLGRDVDPFDEVCDHLIVEHKPTAEIVGTYRLQTGPMAAAGLGYYSEEEFEFGPLEPLRPVLVELGRACIHPRHRNMVVLGMLWKQIGDYAVERGCSCLCGCSSITSQDPAVGARAYEMMKAQVVDPPFRTVPCPPYLCDMTTLAPQETHIPRLLRAYLALGARICGPPALDARFGTIDFLTLLDFNALSESSRARFLD
jgi:putative hemolysin